MDISIDAFVTTMFGENFLNEINQNLRESIRYKMISMIYSHRHEKDDKFIQEIKKQGHSLDFNIIRDVMYKYSKKAQDSFLSDPIESFFLIQFADNCEIE